MKSNPFARNPGQPYAIAAGLVAFAGILRLWPLHAMGTSIPFVTFFPAVIAAAVLGGLLAGSSATLLSCLVLLFVLPIFFQQPFIVEPADWLGLAVFATSGLISSQLANSIYQGSLQKKKLGHDIPEQNATSFVDSSTDAIITTTFDGIINHVNPATERLLGYRADDIVGKPTTALYDPEDIAAARAELRTPPGADPLLELTRAGLPGPQNWTLLSRDGDRRPVTMSMTVIGDRDAPSGFVVAMTARRTEWEPLVSQRSSGDRLLLDLDDAETRTLRWQVGGSGLGRKR